MTVIPRIAFIFGLPLAAAAPAFGQAAAPSDQVVRLSEFEVSEKSPNSYIASETMTGSRVNTKIIDLPYSIVNLTSEFFQDFNIEILDENMTYIGGLTGIGIGGGFNLRGFPATSQLRDGFYRLGRYGLSNVDRLEVIRGPNAAIYGRSSPGGMINMISLQPKKQEVQSLKITEGSYKQNLDNLMLTGSLDHASKTYYVVDLNETSRRYDGQYDTIHNFEDYAAIHHDFSESSHLQVSAEYFLQIQHAPQAPPPVLSLARTATPDNTATTQAIGYDYALANYNPYGPNSELNRGSSTFTAAYDKRFNEVWSTRVGAYYFRARRWDFDANTGWGAITIPASGAPVTTSRGALPSRGEIMEDGGGFQADLKAHYYLFNHKVEANSLLTVDFNDYYRWDPTWEYGPSTDPAVVAWAAPRTVTLGQTVYHGKISYAPTAPVAYFPNRYDPATLALFGTGNSVTGGTSLNGGNLTRRRTSSLGGNLRQQMLFWDGRLITYAGIRNDTVLFSQRDYTVQFTSLGFGSAVVPGGYGSAGQAGGSTLRRYVHQNKPNAGFNLQVVPNLHVYGSYSEAYFVDQTSRPAVIASSTFAPFTAKGVDYGIKGSYFDSRLNFTLGGYYDKEFNVVVNDTVEFPAGSGNFVNIQRQDGDQLVRGMEFDVSWAFPWGLTFGASGAEVNSKYTNFGSQFPEAIGRTVNGISPENGSAYLKYNVPFVQGLYVNVLTTYVSSTPSQTPIAGDTTSIVKGVSVVTAHTDLWKLRNPSYQLWNFSATYRLPRIREAWDQSISFTLNNAFNKFYLKTNTTLGDSRGILLAYTLTHAPAH
jgi:iron complex outermembrane receptor protein